MSKRYLDNEKLLDFFTKMSLIYNSDISIHEGLAISASKEKDRVMVSHYENLKNLVLDGKSISESLKEMDFIENKRYIKLIELGEFSGKLDSVFRDIIDDLSIEIETSNRLKSSLTYPSLLFIITLLMIFIIFTNVIPLFKEIFIRNNAEPNGLTRFVFSISDFLTANILISALLFLLIAGFVYYLLKFKSAKSLRRKLFMNFLTVRNVRKSRGGLNFAKSYLLLIKAGVGKMKAFDILIATETDPKIKQKIKSANEILKDSSDFDAALNELGFLPDFLTSIIAVSTKTGHLESALQSAIVVMKRDFDDSLDRFLSFVEPVMITIVVVIIGLILFAVISPVFGMLDGLL